MGIGPAPRARRGTGHAAAGLALALVLAGLLALAQCAPARQADRTSLRGASLEVVGAWSGAEQQRFVAVLRRFAADTGASVRFTSAGEEGVPGLLTRRLAQGRPPDVALLPQPGLLRRLAADGQLVRPSSDVVAEVRRNYASVWRRLGSFAGRVYGVWFKAANKSLVWYDVAAFEQAGVVPPADVAGLVDLARTLSSSGRPAFAVSARDGWTLTDWFEDLYLQLAGARRYDLLAAHRLSWTHPSVTETLRVMATLLAPDQIAGGVQGALDTDFTESVQTAFGPAAAAAMVHEADFVAGAVASRTSAELGVDVDVFPFPGRRRGLPTVMGGGDVAVILRAAPAADALLRYLATPRAAAVWARRGGFLSPNLNLDLSVYPDDIARSMARNLLDAGEGFRFDLSDLAPPDFGGENDTGMQQALRDFLVRRDVDRAAQRLERAARATYHPASTRPALTARRG